MLPPKRFKASRQHSPVSSILISESVDVHQGALPNESSKSKGESASESEYKSPTRLLDEELPEYKSHSAKDTSLASKIEASSISFGALARAQASLSGANREKSKQPSTSADDYPISSRSTDPNDHDTEALERIAGHKDQRKLSRLSKRAPTELSSKKAVSRKRAVMAVPKRDVRDPRFENILGSIDEQKLRSNYAFLESYKESEIKKLQAELKSTNNEREKEKLRKELLRRESRREAQERKDAEQEVLRRHRKEERAKVESGKAPFYLKRAQVKKEALVERYKHMKVKEVNKVIERRQKKRASREKRNMPGERRNGAR